MAITTSAKKAIRSSARKHVFNLRRKTAMKKALKDIRSLISEKKKGEALKLLPSTYQAIDKAAKTNLIKKNAAARYKSRLESAIAKIA